MGAKSKKRYSTPQLVCHGDVDQLTMKAGVNHADVPIGTPIGSDTRPGEDGPPFAS